MMTHLLSCTFMRNFEGGKHAFAGLFSAVIRLLWPIWWKLNISLSEASRSCKESAAAFGDTGVGVRMYDVSLN